MSKVIKKPTIKKVDEKVEIQINELIELLNELGYSVRIEKGNFKGGFCILKSQKLFLLNKNLDQSKKLIALARGIAELENETIFIKPELREIIEKNIQ
jgi:UDP-N-acetyl-D-mannosaminuronate dehydrogenase